MFDFLRHAAITRGVVLFVDGFNMEERKVLGGDGSSVSAPGGIVGSSGGSTWVCGGLAMAAVLALVTEIYRMAVYPALSLLCSQFLVGAIRPEAVAAMAKWQVSERRSAWRRCESAIRVACLCGACSWHVPLAWLEHVPPYSDDSVAFPGPRAYTVGCMCSDSQSVAARRCPSRGLCQSYTRWLQARFGVRLQSVKWLWLPEGVGIADCSDGVCGGTLTRGLAAQAVPVAESNICKGLPPAQRFRCRSCQVLTHAEVGEALRPRRVALVVSYEHLRWRAASDQAGGAEPWGTVRARRSSGGVVSSGSSSKTTGHHFRRPPTWFHATGLEEVILPHAQPRVKELLEGVGAVKALV